MLSDAQEGPPVQLQAGKARSTVQDVPAEAEERIAVQIRARRVRQLKIGRGFIRAEVAPAGSKCAQSTQLRSQGQAFVPTSEQASGKAAARAEENPDRHAAREPTR